MTRRQTALAAANAALLAVVFVLAWDLHAARQSRAELQARSDETRVLKAKARRIATLRAGQAASGLPEGAADPAGVPAGPAAALQVAEIIDRLVRNPAANMGEAASDLVCLDPDAVIAGLRARWKEICDPEVRRVLLWYFCDSGLRFARTCDFLDLYLSDPDPGVRSLGSDKIRELILRDFEDDPGGYRQWRERTRDLPDSAVWPIAAADFVERVRVDGPDDAAKLLTMSASLRWTPAGRHIQDQDLQDLGDALTGWIGSGSAETVSCALRLAGDFSLPEEFLFNNAIPFLANPATRLSAIGALGSSSNRWAIPSLAPLLRDADPTVVLETARALGEIGDPAVLPEIIEALRRAPGPEFVSKLNASGLQDLTGVRPHPSHDAEWWTRWWQENKESLLEEKR